MAGGGSRARTLGDRLEDLKTASGLSYESIGRKVHLSKSAVHRYCTGANVPREFGIVERIALVCGADRRELVDLHRLWLRATERAGDPAAAEVAPVLVSVERTAPPQPRSHGPKPVARLLIAAVMAPIMAACLAASTAGEPPDAPGETTAGPSWTLPGVPVPSELFGVTINSATGAMPSFRVGAVRLWDGGTRWSEIQRQRGEYDWSTPDRLVNGAEKAELPPLFVFGSTPKWAGPAGPAGPYPDGTPAPPDDLADLDSFVRAVVNRYRGRIEAYELWVLANDRRFYAGSVETLVEMTRRAAGIIRSGDPEATVVCPGMGQLWTTEGVSFLRRFAELGGYDHCDVAGVKLFQREAADPPETMLDLTASLDRLLHEAGIHPRVWNTGTTYTIASQKPLDEAKARNHAVRFFLVGIFARKTNLERMYFYNWGGTKLPVVLQPVGGVPTSAALAVEQLQRWLHLARSRSCGHGAAANLPANVWQCEFTIQEPGRTHNATIKWADRGTASVVAGTRAHELHHLDGTITAIRPGDTITVTEEPVLIAVEPSP